MRIGILGTGAMGQVHASALAHIAGVQLVAFGTRAPAPEGVALAQQHNAQLLSPAELLAQPDIDAVVVATPTDTHLPLVQAAAQTGKHVFCEKPLARTLAEGVALIEATDRAGVRLAVGQVVRYFAAYAHAHSAIARGELGSIRHLSATRGGRFPTVSSGWYANIARSGGVALDLMIHDFDWARWCFGPVADVTVHSPLPHKVVAMLRFASGASGEIVGSWAETAPFRTTFMVEGSAGRLSYDSWASTPPAAHASAGVEVPVSSGTDDPYLLQMREAIAWLQGGPAPRATAADALEALRISLAALESLHTGQPVALG